MNVHTYVRFNSSKTTGSTNIKLGAINHHFEMSVIRGSRRYDDVIIEDNFFQIAFLLNNGIFGSNKSQHLTCQIKRSLHFSAHYDVIINN